MGRLQRVPLCTATVPCTERSLRGCVGFVTGVRAASEDVWWAHGREDAGEDAAAAHVVPAGAAPSDSSSADSGTGA